MTGADVNTCLVRVLLLAAAGALAVWLSPVALDKAARHLRARSKALSRARAVYAEAYREAMTEEF